MRIGFTGTRLGMNDAQLRKLRTLLAELLHADATKSGSEFHHGDAPGADAQAHDVAVALGYEPVVHPPLIGTARGGKLAERMRTPRPPLKRNRDIVHHSELLIAAPAEPIEQLRSGTWSTVRFARKLGRSVWVILPDGEVRRERSG